MDGVHKNRDYCDNILEWLLSLILERLLRRLLTIIIDHLTSWNETNLFSPPTGARCFVCCADPLDIPHIRVVTETLPRRNVSQHVLHSLVDLWDRDTLKYIITTNMRKSVHADKVFGKSFKHAEDNCTLHIVSLKFLCFWHELLHLTSSVHSILSHGPVCQSPRDVWN